MYINLHSTHANMYQCMTIELGMYTIKIHHVSSLVNSYYLLVLLPDKV